MQPLNLPYQSIAGYHLTQKLGSGGMGDVYKAYHRELERTAAIKILHQPGMADRFRNEAYIQSSVKHPNIARLYEFTNAGSNPCIIMEYVEGEPLDTYLLRKSRLSDDEVIRILSQIIYALQYLHGQQIQHRDIKPQNFRIQPDGTVKMLDFGIAKHRYTPKFTREGFIVGTTEYMAPEQFEQRSEMKSDMWSFGVMAYEMATGFMPFEATSPSAQRILLSRGVYMSPRTLVPGISAKLLSVIERCLKPNPSQRASANEINLLMNSASGNAGDPAKAGRAGKLVTPALIALCSVLMLTFIAYLYHYSSAQQTPEDIVDKKTNNLPPTLARKVMINVPGIPKAALIFPDGTTLPAPYEIAGNDGQLIRFFIRAAGYKDRKVEFELKMGPRTYDFILEKQH
jgi:serine/threonine protein kinase